MDHFFRTAEYSVGAYLFARGFDFHHLEQNGAQVIFASSRKLWGGAKEALASKPKGTYSPGREECELKLSPSKPESEGGLSS